MSCVVLSLKAVHMHYHKNVAQSDIQLKADRLHLCNYPHMPSDYRHTVTDSHFFYWDSGHMQWNMCNVIIRLSIPRLCSSMVVKESSSPAILRKLTC